ncbi:MAG: hypothetical protein M3Q07_07640 [Pseudobdellovibrionaceae bacterium]|nr:hypothetical protein [Pseudobdellovibrionaceae bacterium]
MHDNTPSYKNHSDRHFSKNSSRFRQLLMKTLSLILAAALTVSVHVRRLPDSQCLDPRKRSVVEADVRIRATSGTEHGDCREQ